MAPEHESGGDKPDRDKRTVGQLGKKPSSPRHSDAQSQQAYLRRVFVPLKRKLI